jgi:hypothetical protein
MQIPLTNPVEFSIFTISNNQIKETDTKLILALLIMVMSIYAQNTREYYVSGKLRLEGTIDQRGSKIGTWNEFYENGRLKTTTQYEYNSVAYQIDYTRKGTIEQEVKYDGMYFSYVKTPKHTSEYVKGIIRYRDGVSQWTYQCDNVQYGNVTSKMCGYATSLGSRVGFWTITPQYKSEFVKSDTYYAVYDTVADTKLLYLKDEVCFNNGGDCIIGVIKSDEYTLYYYDSNAGSYKFNNSLSWNNSLSYFYSSQNPRKHNADDCDMSDEMLKALKMNSNTCSTFKSIARTYIDRFNAYK